MANKLQSKYFCYMLEVSLPLNLPFWHISSGRRRCDALHVWKDLEAHQSFHVPPIQTLLSHCVTIRASAHGSHTAYTEKSPKMSEGFWSPAHLLSQNLEFLFLNLTKRHPACCYMWFKCNCCSIWTTCWKAFVAATLWASRTSTLKE